MLDRSGQHIGDGLDAAMRMPGKAADIVGRVVVAEIVHHQEGIGHRRIAETEDAVQLDAGAFHGRRGAALMLDGADGHRSGSFRACLELGPNIIDLRCARRRRVPERSVHKRQCRTAKSDCRHRQNSVINYAIV